MGPNKLSGVATILGQVAKWIKCPPSLLILYAPSSNPVLSINTSVQAEHENFSDPTFLDAFDLNFHMPGHFLL